MTDGPYIHIRVTYCVKCFGWDGMVVEGDEVVVMEE